MNKLGIFSLNNSLFTILILDSAYPVDSALEEFFKAGGYALLRAASHQEAVAKTRKFLPGLTLLDCDSDSKNSLSLLYTLLTLHPYGAVILISSQPDVSEAVQAIKMGAVDYLERPLDLRKIKLAIDIQKAAMEED